MSPSIAEYYEGKHVLLTGVTGFVGKCLLEKLLRCCPDVGKVYVVIRPRKGATSQERLIETLNSKVFDTLRMTWSKAELLLKLEVIPGEITAPNLGLAPEEVEPWIKTIQIVVHSAANIGFNLPLYKIAKLNLGGTRNVLNMALCMPKIEAFIFVSTAYSRPPDEEVKEIVYPTNVDPELFLDFVENMPKSWCDVVTPIALEKLPNTYTYSKHLAERLVDIYNHKLPTCIIRPGAILVAYEQPYPGWTEADSAISRYYKSVFDGFNYAPNMDPAVRTLITAVDYTVNLILAAAWKLGQSPKQGTVVYNNAKNALSWKDCIPIGAAEVRKNRRSSLTWYPNSAYESNAMMSLLKNFVFRTIPGFVYDSVLRKANDKSLLKTTQDYIALDKVFQTFLFNEWNFGSSQNTKALMMELSEDDRNTFPMDLDLIDWNELMKRFANGLHTFDPDEKEDGCASAAHMYKYVATIFLTNVNVCFRYLEAHDIKANDFIRLIPLKTPGY